MVRRLARQGAWAVVYLAVTQVLLVVVLVLANRIEGGVIVYNVAFTLFLLPHALFAVPALTALFPRLSRQALGEDWVGYQESVRRGVDAIAFFALAATAAMLALAGPLSRLVVYGASVDSAGAVAGAIRGFAPGVIGYGAFLYLTRAFYSLHDARTPAIANAVVVGAGSVAMVIAFAATEHPTVSELAAVHSAVYLAGGTLLLAILATRQRASVSRIAGEVVRHAGAALAAAAVMLVVAHAVDGDGRLRALATVVVAGGVGGAVLIGARLVLRPGGARVLPDLVAPRG